MTITTTTTNPHTAPELTLGTLSHGFTANTSQLLALAAQLDAAGFPLGDTVTRANATVQAVNDLQVANPIKAAFDAVPDLLALSPQEVADLVHRAALAQVLRSSGALGVAVQEGFQTAFAGHVAREFRRVSDDVVHAMRPAFDGAVSKVRAAHKVGLTTTTTRENILDTADARTLNAFRELGPAVDTLEQLAALRVTMCNLAGIGPVGRAIACLVDPATEPDLDAAAAVYIGIREPVTIPNSHPSAGPSVRWMAAPRLGGRWLDLIAHGYTPRLNTADEADAFAASDATAPEGEAQ